MATIPLSNTNIRLISGVPFYSDYKDTRYFDNLIQQTNYFLAKPLVHAMSNANFVKTDNGQYTIKVNKHIDDLLLSNYLMFQNAGYSTKWFYCFIERLTYEQSTTTTLHLKLDVYQTWLFDMNFKSSYVLREHCQLWNTDGTPVINTVDEGLNYGDEYETVSAMQYTPTVKPIKWLVIACKQTMHLDSNNVPINEIKPCVIGSIQPLSYYLIPFENEDDPLGVNIPKIPAGALISKPSKVLEALYTYEIAVNNIASIYLTDFIGINYSVDSGGLSITIESNSIVDVVPALIEDTITSNVFTCLYVEKVTRFVEFSRTIFPLYSDYKTVKESKLLMYPYTVLVLDDFRGNRQEYKNEYFSNRHIAPNLQIKGSIGTSNKVSYGFNNYNTNISGFINNKISNETALINNDPSDIPIVTDMLSAYLQGHRNSIQNQQNTIKFNGTMNAISSGVNIASSLIGKPNKIQAISGVTDLVQGAGNTVLQLQAINAKQKDIDNTPPNITKQGSNTAYTFGNEYQGVFAIKKQIKQEWIDKLENFFNMYGYKVNVTKVPNMHTRQYWNYVQTQSCVITGNFNNDNLVELKQIFDSGITLWHTDDVGNYSLNNVVL